MGIGTYILVSIIKILIAVFILLTAVAYTTLLERKVVAHMQNRWGPSRVGPFGIWQPLADGLKFIFKEDLTPPYAYKPLYLAAPMIALVTALTSIAVIPIGPWITLGGISTPLQITDVNIGLLIILGITSVGVYGVALAGWSSNSKYSMLASLRASAQMMSYEIALGLSLIGVLILAGSFSLRDIVNSQAGTWLGFIPKWNLFKGQIVAFFIYMMAAYAETNRIPFDLAEAEIGTGGRLPHRIQFDEVRHVLYGRIRQHVYGGVSGFHPVFGRMEGPVFGPPIVQSLLPVFWFAVRVFGFIFVYIWVRGTLPRFRYDQLMAFGWKFLLPLAIANIVVTALVVALK